MSVDRKIGEIVFRVTVNFVHTLILAHIRLLCTFTFNWCRGVDYGAVDMQSQSDNAVVAVAPPPPSWRRASTVRLTIPRSICRTLSCIGWRKTVTTICRDGDGITPSSYTAGGIYRSVTWLYQNNIVVRCLYVRCVCWTCKLLTTCCTNSLNIYSSLFTITVSMQPADSITYCCIILSYIWQTWNRKLLLTNYEHIYSPTAL